jgi:hypothetical protein
MGLLYFYLYSLMVERKLFGLTKRSVIGMTFELAITILLPMS